MSTSAANFSLRNYSERRRASAAPAAPRGKPSLHINEGNLDMIGSNKYLGVQIDSELKWREHITFAIGKISRAMDMLKYAKKYLPLDIVRNMYTSIVEPHFRNCCSVWGCCGETLLDKLQKLQNRVARIVTNSSYDASSLPLIGSLGWLTIKEMIEFKTATTVYKSLHGLAPEYMRQMFTKLSENTSRSLRNTNTDLRIPRFATSYGQRSFSYRGVTVWNKLSTEIKTCPFTGYFQKFAETIFEKSKGVKVPVQHQTFSSLTRIYSILIFRLVCFELLVN